MKQWMKKSLAACLALVMCLTLAACGGKEGETPAEESVNVRVAALKGPTAMGMVKLMSDYAPVEEALEDKENVVTAGGGNTYEFTLAASADEVSPKLMQGELDIACVPANLASVLYNRTDGGVVTLAVNTLGVLYIVENGNSVQSMACLLYTSGLDVPALVEPVSAQNGPCGLAVVIGDADGGCQGFPGQEFTGEGVIRPVIHFHKPGLCPQLQGLRNGDGRFRDCLLISVEADLHLRRGGAEMGVASMRDGKGQPAQREFLAGLRPGIALEISPLVGPVGLAEPTPYIQPEISGQTVVQGFQLVCGSDAIRGEGCGEKDFLIHGKGPILSGEGSVFPRGLRRKLPAVREKGGEEGGGVVPVSYTHLDVYKRQCWGGSCRNPWRCRPSGRSCRR